MANKIPFFVSGLCSSEISGIKDKEAKGEESKTPEKSGTTEYHNLVYKDLEKSDKLDIFSENKNIEKVEEFSEIDL